MADKDLKSLTIGNQTYRNLFTDPNIGTDESSIWSGSQSVPSYADTAIGDALTIPEDGLYYLTALANAQGSTTGDVYRYIFLRVNSSDEFKVATILPNQNNVWHEWKFMKRLNKNDVVRAYMYAYAPFTCRLVVLRAFKMPVYPGLKED